MTEKKIRHKMLKEYLKLGLPFKEACAASKVTYGFICFSDIFTALDKCGWTYIKDWDNDNSRNDFYDYFKKTRKGVMRITVFKIRCLDFSTYRDISKIYVSLRK